MSGSDDEEFTSLKPSLRRIIDTAFLKLSKQARTETTRPLRKKPRLEEPASTSDEEGGGFERGDPEASEEEYDGIPLSMVPTGLQMLDLPPDDKEVLSVFRNAATGWENRPGMPRRRTGSDDEAVVDKDAGLLVSRADWRAVCAVLLGQKEDEEEKPGNKRKRGPERQIKSKNEEQSDRRVTRGQARAVKKRKLAIEESDEEEAGGFLVDHKDEGGGFVLDSDDEQDEPHSGSDEDLGDALDGSDSDRYSDDDDASSVSEFGAPVVQAKPTRSKTKKDTDSEVDTTIDDNWTDDMPRSLTVRQLREAKLAFALFFPSTGSADPSLNSKRLGIKQVQEAAKTLKENLSSNDIIEMLGMFSSAPDGSIGLEEFGRMAVMARLI
ncbi:hypothetical protein RSOLAG1IB_09600 [Rhizoctonia solani AG-1 IB]|uniref:EF-hand domain-containing protein n=1 Tax=Thanatephorus cucumeris (strain AG1-IB / isolate 7/3/14) TaxID=1108050 RepID=A0A0B7FW15_THACB|nr:hypothetical protein RSOLAG1IB_09600 [Rhizoctonia solani AG-1 IB]